ncbi:MAG: ribonuclease E/G [Janthinobacterium lividum]
MDNITILETQAGVFLSHFKDDDLLNLILTDFSDDMRLNDVFKGKIQRLEGNRAWVDIGFAKAALLKYDPKTSHLYVGKSVYVTVDRVQSLNKGAKVQLKSESIIKDHLSNLHKIFSAPEEWLDYIQSLEKLDIKTNSVRILHAAQDLKNNHKVTIKSDLIPSPDVHNAWSLCQENRVDIWGGGWIFIEEGETLIAIDVNTGGGEFSSRDLKEDRHWLDFNQKCAKIIFEQIKLRQLGGIIMIDFPRLQKIEHQKILFQTIKRYADPQVQVLGFTRGGLFELTRTKSQKSLSQRLKRNNIWASFLNLNQKD